MKEKINYFFAALDFFLVRITLKQKDNTVSPEKELFTREQVIEIIGEES